MSMSFNLFGDSMKLSTLVILQLITGQTYIQVKTFSLTLILNFLCPRIGARRQKEIENQHTVH